MAALWKLGLFSSLDDILFAFSTMSKHLAHLDCIFLLPSLTWSSSQLKKMQIMKFFGHFIIPDGVQFSRYLDMVNYYLHFLPKATHY